MILANPLFKNLNMREQKVLQKLIYKAEMTEIFIRDRNVVRINQSFDEIMDSVMDMIDGSYSEEEVEENRRREEDEF
jgi:hypothetical protein